MAGLTRRPRADNLLHRHLLRLARLRHPPSWRLNGTMASQDVPKTCKVILADSIAKKMLAEVKDMLVQVQGPDGVAKPTLAAFLANDDPAAAQYAEWSKKTCEEK